MTQIQPTVKIKTSNFQKNATRDFSLFTLIPDFIVHISLGRCVTHTAVYSNNLPNFIIQSDK